MKKKFFIDCEFHEYAKQPKLFGVIPIGKPIPTVELISIALVNEDGTKHFYAEADWYNKRAVKKHLFISKNVLPNLIGGKYIMSKEEIKKGILDFIGNGEDEVELIGWWSAYDWVVFCQLFGSMTKTMPKTGFWYYTDLKTMLADTLNWDKKDVLRWTPGFGIAHNALDDAIWLKNSYFKIKDIIKIQLTKHLAMEAHESLCSLIPHVFSRCIENEDGSYTIPKKRAEKWLKRANKDFLRLTANELRTPANEAIKYVTLFENYFQLLK